MGKTERRKVSGKKQLTFILFSGLLALFGSILLLLFFSVMILKEWFSPDFAPKLSLASCAVCGFFCSLFAVKNVEGNPSLIGFSVGVTYFLLLLLLGFLVVENVAPGFDQLPLACSCLCAAVLAGLFQKKGRKRRRN